MRTHSSHPAGERRHLDARMVRVEWHALDPSFAREWDELATSLAASPFLRPGWIAAWSEAFATGPLTLVVVRHGHELVGLVPLRQADRGRGLRSASNEHSPEFGFLASDRETASELARALFDARPGGVRLDFVDSDDIGLAECRSAGSQHGYRTLVTDRIRSPFLQIDGDWRGYTRELPRKPRSEAERRFRRLRELGEATLDVADGSERLDDLLEQGFRVEASGWKGQRGTAIAVDPVLRTFYTAVARWACDRGWLRLCFLRLDGRPLAFVFGLEVGGVFYSVKAGFDPAFARFGPGGVLRHQLLARAFSSGLARYEFLGDAEPWKLEWTSSSRQRVSFHAYPPTVWGLVESTARSRIHPLVKRVPLVRTLARGVRR